MEMKLLEPNIPTGTVKGKIGVLIESHFDETEFLKFNTYFPQQGYQVDYMTNLWGQESLTFEGNDKTMMVKASIDVSNVSPMNYKGIVLIGGYAMDRLRYEAKPIKGTRNSAPAVEFLRKAVEVMDSGSLKIGTICHSLWLFCAAPDILKNRKVTCAHNIVCDVLNAGGIVSYEDNGIETVELCVDGGLITGKHPQVVDNFMESFINEIEK